MDIGRKQKIADYLKLKCRWGGSPADAADFPMPQKKKPKKRRNIP